MDHCHLYQQLKCCHSRNIGGSALRDMVSVDNDLRRRFGFEGPHMRVLPSLLHMRGVHCHGVRGGSGVASSRRWWLSPCRVICSLAQIEPLFLLVHLS